MDRSPESIDGVLVLPFFIQIKIHHSNNLAFNAVFKIKNIITVCMCVCCLKYVLLNCGKAMPHWLLHEAASPSTTATPI